MSRPLHSLLVTMVSAAALSAQAIPGWRGDPRIWRLEQDVLVGSSVGVELAANTFLVREGEVGDFELRAEIQLEGDNNSGIQYRSRELPGEGFRVRGYQCDWHPTPNYAAMLYEEQGAGIVARRGQFVCLTDAGIEPLGTLAKVTPVDVKAWHRLRIVARGDLCWHELDGRLVTAVQDLRAAAPRRGAIALQVHAGQPMTVRVRGLTVTAFEDAAAADLAAPVPAALIGLLRRAEQQRSVPRGEVPQWVWDEQANDGEELFFRRAFVLTSKPEQARLAVTCDNHCRVYVNGERVGESDSWEAPFAVDVTAQLVVGDNVVAVHGWNDGGPAAMALRLGLRDGGELREIVTDATWRCDDDDPDGWWGTGFDDGAWSPVRVLGAVGQADAPWTRAVGVDALGTVVDEFAPQIAVVDPEVDVDLDGEVLHLLDVPRSLGSWVALCADDRGRLYASDQRRGLYRILPAAAAGESTTIERVRVALGGANGLLWWRDSLYAVVNGPESGLYRVSDADGDDQLDRVELLRALQGSGEHGPHSVVVAPDGEHLLVLCGNHTELPELVSSRVPMPLAEDRLVPRLDDPHTYWEGHSPPGGWVCEVDADGREWELVCCGFRNPYDLVVMSDGMVVVYDADMEWDMGLPWYRPTRLLQVKSGVDYGWRIGSAKWPADYPDAPPALCDIGPGSPTGMAGVVSWERVDTLLALDWTFGTVYLANCVLPDGGRFQLRQLASAAPWPVADVAVTERGTFVLAGGRGLPSSLVRLPLAHDRSSPPFLGRPRAQWDSFADFATRSPAELLAEAADRDRVAARVALEHLPVAAWRELALACDPAEAQRAWAGLLALARRGTGADLGPLLATLGRFDFASLPHLDRIAWLRVHALALLHLGPAEANVRRLLADRLLPLFPTGDEREDQDLCELLAFVDAPGLLDRAVPLLTPLRPSAPPPWAEVLTRNDTYGGVIATMLGNMPPIGQLAIANALRTVAHGWTLDQRRELFAFLGACRQRSGGSSYDGFVQKLIDAAWLGCSPAEQQQLADDVGKAKAELPSFQATPPQGPGRDWQLADIAELTRVELAGRDLDSGRNLFHAAGCAACHYFAGEGGFGGPDLTSLGNKFGAADVLEAILAPSQVISDQYAGKVLTKRDGSALFGVVRRTFDGDTEVYEVIPARADASPVRIPVADVVTVQPSPLSPMPTDLVDRLSADEVRDLLAFLLSRGRR